MTLQLQLDPASEAVLQEKATRRGVSPEEYVESLVKEDISAAEPRRGSPEDMKRWLESLAERAKDLPHLPTSAFTRESFYEDD